MFITAERIHDGKKWLPEGTVIELNDAGQVIAIAQDKDIDGLVTYEGVLCPGFVNVHCHMELSHMKGVIPEHTTLIPFLKTIPRHRNDFTDEQKTAARADAYKEMLDNGIVAVGDIANTTDTLDVRAQDKMHVHTFVEAIGFSEVNAERSYGFAIQTLTGFEEQKAGDKILRQSVTPHAPYSVSWKMFGLIDGQDRNAPLSIHNQESREEDRYYMLKEGGVQDLLHTLGVDDGFFVPSGKSSLQTYLEWLKRERDFIFVHNTYSSRNDVQLANSYVCKAWWCLCPNANLYIENTLPDIKMLMKESENICVGTDSLASNHQLSIMAELVSIKKYFPAIEWEELLRWGTYNGACALQMDNTLGSIAIGKKPGIVQIQNLNDAPVVRRLF